MNVGFDGYHIGLRSSAWGATQTNLIRRLAAADPKDLFVVFVTRAGSAMIPFLPNVRAVVINEARLDNAISRVRSIAKAVKSWHITLDVYIETCEISPNFGPHVRIFSIEHDFSEGNLEGPISLGRLRGLIYKQLHIRSIGRTSTFFCNSHFTLSQLARYLGAGQSATVFPHGCDDIYVEGRNSNSGQFESSPPIASQPYLLYVGRVRVRHKNVALLLRAFRFISSNYPNLKLVIVSSQNLTSEQRGLIRSMMNRIIVLQSLESNELANLYKGASALILPSTYEGFGIPIIEAQNMRCPVILNDIDVFREVAGNGGIFFDGTVGDLVRKVDLVMDKNNADSYVRLGFENARHFSWVDTAEIIRHHLDKERTATQLNKKSEK